MKIVTVVGARPQFVKAAPVSDALRAAGHDEFLLHTGQHYDDRMSRIFFEELGIPEPAMNLGVGSGRHGRQTGEMLAGIEEALVAERPDWVLVYGDTNSTLAGALAAAKLGIPLAHVEAGLRSHVRSMPEEINRVLTDRVSDLLLCPSPAAAAELGREGITEGVHVVGDVMYDAVLRALPRAERIPSPVEPLGLEPGRYLLATVHRAENTDDPRRLAAVVECLGAVREPIVFPVHPRTAKALERTGLRLPENVRVIDPVGYLTMLRLLRDARAVLTDSGGLQKEAFWLETPCITLRDETEWVETVDAGWNRITGVAPERVCRALAEPWPAGGVPPVYGDGSAAQRIVALLERS